MLRRSFTGLRPAMSSPSMVMVPAEASTMRFTIRRIVVLPLPEEPRRTVVLWGGNWALKSSTATVPSG